MEDSYREHSLQSQQYALDAEQTAYEETMNKFIEGIRLSLEEATLNMDEFLMGVTSMVMYNADTVLTKYRETNLPLTTELTNPWERAKEAVGNYSGNALALMNKWTESGGFFEQFNATGTTNLQSPWNAGTSAATAFKTSVDGVMDDVVDKIATNVQSASSELSRLYQQIKDTEARAASAKVTPDNNTNGYNRDDTSQVVQKKYYTTATLQVGSNTLTVTKSDHMKANAERLAKTAITGLYEDYMKSTGRSEASYESSWLKTYRNRVKYDTKYYAKGTLGTKRDEWAITDELGPELKMYATPEGNLSFMAVGSTVVPADLTKDIMEIADLGVEGLVNTPKFNSGVNVITNAVNKPEINLSFDALVKAERIDENTLPEVKRYVQQEINTLVKQMNYAIKGKGGR